MWIKICGLTQSEDAVHATTCGVSALGLNFYRGSKRFVEPEDATKIVESVREVSGQGAVPDLVGVFVNSPPEEIVRIVHGVGLNAVQFHGDESLDHIQKVQDLLPSTHLIRAVRISIERLEDCLLEIDRLSQHVSLAACLLDAWVPGEYGGTGHTVSAQIADAYLAASRPRLILAGGLKASNVREAINACMPWGVDTASGVETSPGKKSSQEVSAFIRNARSGTVPTRIARL